MSYTTSITNCGSRELGLDELDAVSAGLHHVDGLKVLGQATAGAGLGALIGGAVGTLAGGPAGTATGATVGTVVGAVVGAAYEVISELF